MFEEHLQWLITITAKPMKTLELHYLMIQFLINCILLIVRLLVKLILLIPFPLPEIFVRLL